MKTLSKYISEGGFFSNVRAGSAEEAWLESAFSTGVFDEKLRPYIKIEHNGDSKLATIKISVDRNISSGIIGVNINDECFPGAELPKNIRLIFDVGSERADFKITGKYLKSFRGFGFTSDNMESELYMCTLNLYNIKIGSFDGMPMMKKLGWVYIGAADDYSKLSDICFGVSVYQGYGLSPVLTDVHKMLGELGYVNRLTLEKIVSPKYKAPQLVKDVEDYIARVTTEGTIDMIDLSSNKIKTYKNNNIKRSGGVKVIDLSDNPLNPTAPDFELPVCTKSVRISSRIYAKIFGWKNQLKHQLSKDNVYKNIELIRTNY